MNDASALGRETVNVRDPDAPSQFVDTCILESQPLLVQNLVQSQFRAVRVAAGDNVSVALDHEGNVRAWGGFRVCLSFPFAISNEAISHVNQCISPRTVLLALTTMMRKNYRDLNQ